MKNAKTVQELAATVRNGFMLQKRSSGSEFWSYKGVTPGWIQDMCRDAHGDMMPDDHTYQFICESLSAISDSHDEDEAGDMLEADIYTHDLMTYLSSHTSRLQLVNEAVQDICCGNTDKFDLLGFIQIAQVNEKRQVLYSVYKSLNNKINS